MRAVVQRVSRASVSVEGEVIGSIGSGLLVLLGVECGDSGEEVTWLARKIVRMRIFRDEAGALNRSVQDVCGELLIVSQFTLLASTRQGNRPSFLRSAKPGEAIALYESFVAEATMLLGKPPATGRFGASMAVELLNDGPVTIFLDTRLRE